MPELPDVEVFRQYMNATALHLKNQKRCPKCGGTIKHAQMSGRTSYYCAKHQKK